MIDPDKSIGFLVHDIAHLSRRTFNRRASDLGMSQSQVRALACLARCEGINQVRLAEKLDIQPMTLVRHIDRLEAAGLVAREADPDDRRAVRLRLTPSAQPLLDRMFAIGSGLWNEATATLDATEREFLLGALQRIKRSLSEANPDLCLSPNKKEDDDE